MKKIFFILLLFGFKAHAQVNVLGADRPGKIVILQSPIVTAPLVFSSGTRDTFSLGIQSAYTLLGNNTGSSAAPTFFFNNFSDSLRRVGVNIQRRVNGNWYTQFTDSVGGGGSITGLTTRYVPFWNGTALADGPIYIDTLLKVYINTVKYSTTSNNPVLVVAPGTLKGTIATTLNSATVPGTGTEFLSDYKVGDLIYANGQLRQIAAIASNTSLTTTTNWTSTASGLSHKDSSVSQGAVSILNNGNIQVINQTNAIQTIRFPGQSIYIGNGVYAPPVSSAPNTFIGYNSGLGAGIGNVGFGNSSNPNGTGTQNTSVGYSSLLSASSGSDNTVVGNFAGAGISSGLQNSIYGSFAYSNGNGSNVCAMGYECNRRTYDGFVLSTSTNSAYYGASIKSGKVAATNENVFGYNGRGNGDNTNTIGNTSTVSTFLYGDIGTPISLTGTLSGSPSTTGGLVPAGTWYYTITAVDALGKTTAYLASATVTTTGTTSSVVLTLPSLPLGAVSFNVYRCVAFAAPGASTLVATGVTGSSYTDVLAATTSGTPSLLTNAYLNKFSSVSGVDNYINNGGNLLLGGNIAPTSMLKGLALFNGTSPSANISGISLWSNSGELNVRDASGNVTVLSPHNFDHVVKSNPMAWSYTSQNDSIGKWIQVDMYKTIKTIEKQSNEIEELKAEIAELKGLIYKKKAPVKLIYTGKTKN